MAMTDDAADRMINEALGDSEQEQPQEAQAEFDLSMLFPERTARAISGFKYITPDQVWSPYPAREPTAKLRESIHRWGVRRPVEIIEEERDGRPYRLEEGQRRVAVAVEQGIKKIPAVFHDGGDPYAGSLTESSTADENPAAELFFVENLVAMGLSQKQIMTATRMDAGSFKKLIRLQALVSRLRDPFDRGEIKVSIARACANLPTTTQERLADLYEARIQDQEYKGPGLTSADIKAEREAQRQNAAAQSGLGGDFDDGDDDADETVGRGDLIDVVKLLIKEYAPECNFERTGLTFDQRETIQRVYAAISG